MILLDHFDQRRIEFVAADPQRPREDQTVVDHRRDRRRAGADIDDERRPLVCGIDPGAEDGDEPFIDEMDVADPGLFRRVAQRVVLDVGRIEAIEMRTRRESVERPSRALRI